MPYNFFIQGAINKKTSFFSLTLFLFLFSSFYFLNSNTVSAIGFRMWEKDVTTSSVNPSLPIKGSATVVVMDPNGLYIYIAGQDNGESFSPFGEGKWRIEKRRTDNGLLCNEANCGASEKFGTDGIRIFGMLPGQIRTMVLDNDRNLYVGGYQHNITHSLYYPLIVRFDLSGNIGLMTPTLSGSVYASYLDIAFYNNNVYVVGEHSNLTVGNIVQKLDVVSEVWTDLSILPTTVFLKTIEVDSTGIYVAGYQGPSPDTKWYVAKLPFSGGNTPTWEKTYNGTGGGSDVAWTMTIGGGYVYTGGMSNFLLGRIEKRDITTGNLVSTFNSTGEVLFNDFITFIKSIKLGQDGLYVAVYQYLFSGGGSEVWDFQKLDIITGNILWKQQQRGSTDFFGSIVLDNVSPQNIYMVGGDYSMPAGGAWRIEKTAQEVKVGGVIRAVHVQDLRREINRVRGTLPLNLPPFSWNEQVTTPSGVNFGYDDVIISTTTTIRAAHIQNIMNAFNGVCKADLEIAIKEPISLSIFNNISSFIAYGSEGCLESGEYELADFSESTIVSWLWQPLRLLFMIGAIPIDILASILEADQDFGDLVTSVWHAMDDVDVRSLGFSWKWVGNDLWTKLDGAQCGPKNLNYGWKKTETGVVHDRFVQWNSAVGEANDFWCAVTGGCNRCSRKVTINDTKTTATIGGLYNPQGSGDWQWGFDVNISEGRSFPRPDSTHIYGNDLYPAKTKMQCESAGGVLARDLYHDRFMCKFIGSSCPTGFRPYRSGISSIPGDPGDPEDLSDMNQGWWFKIYGAESFIPIPRMLLFSTTTPTNALETESPSVLYGQESKILKVGCY